MSIPKSRVLSVSKGFGASAEIYHSSPVQTSVVNVNVKDPSEVEVNDGHSVTEVKPVEVKPVEPNLDGSVNDSSLLQYKDNVIEALQTLLTIVEHNPLIVNKYIIASVEDLSQLIKLLTGADTVQINTDNDVDCNCVLNSKVHFASVEKIYVIKGNEAQNFKYSYPDANKILDDHRVSVKLVKV